MIPFQGLSSARLIKCSELAGGAAFLLEQFQQHFGNIHEYTIDTDTVNGFNTRYKFHEDYYESELAPAHSLPTWNFSPWGWRNQCYIIGLMTGYLLHITKDKGVKIHPALNLIIWAAVSSVAFLLVYGPHWITTEDQYSDYRFMHKWTWGLCLSWVTFACVRGYGGNLIDLIRFNV